MKKKKGLRERQGKARWGEKKAVGKEEEKMLNRD